MKHNIRISAVAGTLGLISVFTIYLLSGENKSSTLDSSGNEQQSIAPAVEYPSSTTEELYSNLPDSSSDTALESEILDIPADEFIELSEEEAQEFEKYLQSQTDGTQATEEALLEADDFLAGTEPFIGHEAGIKYNNFFSQLESDESLTEEEIQAFFKQMLATLEASDEAKDAIANAYRSTSSDDVMERGILTEMLMKTETGREILLAEAQAILENGQADRFSDMFQTYQNVDETINAQVLDQALYSAATTNDLGTAISALNYIGKLEDNKDFSPVYMNQAVSTLENISRSNEDEDIRSLATQKLYRLLGPDQSTAIAQYNIDNNISSALVIETLYSISSGDVKLTKDLETSLVAAIQREGVTQEEVDLAKDVLTETQGS